MFPLHTKYIKIPGEIAVKINVPQTHASFSATLLHLPSPSLTLSTYEFKLIPFTEVTMDNFHCY